MSGLNGVRRCSGLRHGECVRRQRRTEPDGAGRSCRHRRPCYVCGTRRVASVTRDIEALRSNTAIARLMELVNGLTVASAPAGGGDALRQAALRRSPWHLVRKSCGASWATNARWLTQPGPTSTRQHEDTQEYVVQVNGKVRSSVEGAIGLDAVALLAVAKADPVVIALLGGRAVVKEIGDSGAIGELRGREQWKDPRAGRL